MTSFKSYVMFLCYLILIIFTKITIGSAGQDNYKVGNFSRLQSVAK